MEWIEDHRTHVVQTSKLRKTRRWLKIVVRSNSGARSSYQNDTPLVSGSNWKRKNQTGSVNYNFELLNELERQTRKNSSADCVKFGFGSKLQWLTARKKRRESQREDVITDCFRKRRTLETGTKSLSASTI